MIISRPEEELKIILKVLEKSRTFVIFICAFTLSYKIMNMLLKE